MPLTLRLRKPLPKTPELHATSPNTSRILALAGIRFCFFSDFLSFQKLIAVIFKTAPALYFYGVNTTAMDHYTLQKLAPPPSIKSCEIEIIYWVEIQKHFKPLGSYHSNITTHSTKL